MAAYDLPKVCDLCRFPIQDTEAVSHLHRHERDTYGNSRFSGYRYHLDCAKLHTRFCNTVSLAQIGRAFMQTIPMAEPFNATQPFRYLKRSSSPLSLSLRITQPCNKGNCDCLTCILKRIEHLPPKIWSQIIPLLQPSMQRIISYFGETTNLIAELERSPAGLYSLSCEDDIFQTVFEYGGKSYVTGLFNKEVLRSEKIKSKDGAFNYMAVWTDGIGVTRVEFLYRNTVSACIPAIKGKQQSFQRTESCWNCLQAKSPEREWVYAIPVDTKRIYWESKGVFLDRVLDSSDNRTQMWDCLEPLLLFQPRIEHSLPTIFRDLHFRYIPLAESSGISVAFCSGRFIAISTHRRNSPQSRLYIPTSEDIVWAHCPLSMEEPILAIWVVRHMKPSLDFGLNFEISVLVIRTKHKTVWLGGYISPEMQTKQCIVQIADSSVCALYYRYPHSVSSDAGAFPNHSFKNSKQMDTSLFPMPQSPAPNHRSFDDSSYYTEASLQGLLHVRLCLDDDYCLGMEFDYGHYCVAVGQFRYDKVTTDPLVPNAIGLMHVEFQSNPRVRIRYFNESSSGPEEARSCQRLDGGEGTITWWHCRDASTFSFVPPEVSAAMYDPILPMDSSRIAGQDGYDFGQLPLRGGRQAAL
ncbi:hypothetical protein BU24DRAFT_417703 [Aaosphaeria arxii CBS 175.79]|uniref:Uncharacterized protein n=1 Tax=Aaosphaeria arxii CBS 175.79 TaxID=1450172 RepID=A0A6A5YAK5_9PLEO|nr:uncharacterized protein BU24DRAFT_417703 [Aaosphaeria arxii CBS 175.79]KAF2022057.1 hypothetical protein BU24DRAFT_417703 [Aaosphaeria arxii CBS 175.79]